MSESDRKNAKFNDQYPVEIEDSEDDEENYRIRASDCLLIAGKIEQESATLEIYVYEEKEYNLFVHHDIMLSSFPVALEWLCCDFSSTEGNEVPRANLAIVGLMTPEIEIWDLDAMEPVEPITALGGKAGHTDAVTSLALHTNRPNLLASVSADKSLRLWDLQTQKTMITYKGFKDRAQGVTWSLENESTLFSFSGDNILKVFDARDQNSVNDFQLDFGIENFTTCPSDPSKLLFSSEDGFVHVFDLKKFEIIKDFSVKAHTKAIPSIVCNSLGHFITDSLDGLVKIFDLNTLELLAQQKTDLGMLFSSSVHPENPYLFACGSSMGELVVWDYKDNLASKK